jgi:hypothetical protein
MQSDDGLVFEESISITRSWMALPAQDKCRYSQLREVFLHRSLRDKPDTGALFESEIQSVRQFVDYSPIGREDRAIIAGLAMSADLVAVNTRQLKNLIGRCKSSINAGFHRLGFAPIRAKPQVRERVLAALPLLRQDPASLRRWTVRVADATEEAAQPGEIQETAEDGGIDLFRMPDRKRTAQMNGAVCFGWSDDESL